MIFAEALKQMKKGAKMKLPSWHGYWCWDEEKEVKCKTVGSNPRLYYFN